MLSIYSTSNHNLNTESFKTGGCGVFGVERVELEWCNVMSNLAHDLYRWIILGVSTIWLLGDQMDF